MAETFADFSDLPVALKDHFRELEDFIGSLDGEITADDATIDAEDAVKAFNGIIAWLKEAKAQASLTGGK